MDTATIKQGIIYGHIEQFLYGGGNDFDYTINTFVLLRSENSLLKILNYYYKLLYLNKADSKRIQKLLDVIFEVLKYNAANNIYFILDTIELIILMEIQNENNENIKMVEQFLCVGSCKKIDPDLKSSNYKIILSCADINPISFACELTYMCFTHMKKISSCNYIDRIINKSNNSAIDSLLDLSEKISNLIPYKIITAGSPSEQVSIIKYFVTIAKYLNKFRNYHIFFAVMSGMNDHKVDNIEHLWKNQTYLKTFAKLNKIISPSNNYRAYRNELRIHSGDNILPYTGLIQADFEHMLEHETIDSDSNTINHELLKTIYSYMNTIDNYKHNYWCENNPDINFYVSELTVMDLDKTHRDHQTRRTKLRSNSFNGIINKRKSIKIKKNSSTSELMLYT